MMISRRLWRENRNLYVCSLCNNGLRLSRPVAWAHPHRWNSSSSNGPPKSAGWGASGVIPRARAKRSNKLTDESAARRAIPGATSRAPENQQKPSGLGSPSSDAETPPKPSGSGPSSVDPTPPPEPSGSGTSSSDRKPPPKPSGWGSSEFTLRAPPVQKTGLSDHELAARNALLPKRGSGLGRNDRSEQRDRGPSWRRGDGAYGRMRNNPRWHDGDERSDTRMRSPRPGRNENFWVNLAGSDRGHRSERSDDSLPSWNSLPRRPRRDDTNLDDRRGGPRPESPPDSSQMDLFEALGKTASNSRKPKYADAETDGSWASKYSKPPRAPSVEVETPRYQRASASRETNEVNRHAPDWGSRQANSREERRESATAKKARGRRGAPSRREEEDDDDFDEEYERHAEERRRKKAEEKAARKAARGNVEEVARHQLFLPEYISVQDLARVLNFPLHTFLRALTEYGFEDVGEDSILTGETAGLIAQESGFEVKVDDGMARDIRPQPEPEDPTSVPSRPPVVAIMGHVDHGKTTLLDYLRKSSIVASEHGGITQHIGAFIVNLSSGKSITFLDTPGHAAFLTMRQRGAEVTDIVILVVAADDSVMPQTLEALKHARAANVPIIVAITKCDKEDARVDQVKADLSQHGVEIEDYGGDVQVVPVSGKTGKGMSDLEENIVTLSEILDVRGDPECLAEGWVIEASVKPVGKAATVLVKKGTLRIGDYLVCGTAWAKVRVLRNEAGQEIKEAPPGSPVEVLGWRDELPKAGDRALQPPDEARARSAVDYRREMQDRSEVQKRITDAERQRKEIEAKAAAEAAAGDAEGGAEGSAEADAEAGMATVNFIVRADVTGSVEAVAGTIQEIGNHEVQPRILRAAAGTINETDVEYASMSRSVIVNFNNTIPGHIKGHADEAGVKIIDHSVIYHLADEIKAELSKKLPDLISQRVSAEAEVLQVFPINVKGRVYKNIAGCRIRNGTLKKTDMVRVYRKGEKIFDGKLDSLKHGKKDVSEMKKGSECGVGCLDFQDLEAGDLVQGYEEVREKRSL